MAKEVKEIVCPHIQGLPNVNQGKECKLYIEDDALKIAVPEKAGFIKPKYGKPFNLPISKIIAMDMVSRSNIQEKSKSVVGRGLAGGLIFGPIGAIVGGMSGTGTKSEDVNKYYINIAYYNKNGEIKTMIFEKISIMAKEFDFVDQFRAKYITSKLETNDDGEIML